VRYLVASAAGVRVVKPERKRGLWAAGAGIAVAGAITAGKLLARKERRGPDETRGDRFDELPPEDLGPVVSFDGTLLHVRAAGDPQKPAIVFGHGFSVDMTTWHYQWKELSRDYRCVLYDQRGHGRSGQAVGGDHSLQAMGRDLKAVLDAAVGEGPAVVVGHSMGGMAVLAMAEAFPEEFGARVAGAVFADTAAAEVLRGAAGALGVRLMALAPSLGRTFAKTITRDAVRRRVTKSDLAYLIARLSNFGPHAPPSMVEYVVELSMRAPMEVWSDGIRALLEMDLTHAIEHVRCPSIVIVGDLDRLTPPSSALALKRKLPDGRLVVLEGAGHMAPMERHDQFDELLRDFVAEAFAGASTSGERAR
jgi:pimeloyl-ACP methyl ester carboxylesterase